MIDLKKFKVIPGFSRYMISEDGDVYNIKLKRLMSPCKNWAGYLTVTLIDDNNFRSPRKIHRLVYLTYVGPLDPNKVVDHKDDNKLHNHYTNLQQITPSENSLKSFISGKNSTKVVWTKEQIHLICEMMENSVPSYLIFTNLGIDYYSNRTSCNMLIGQLRRGEIHQDVAKQYNLKDYICGINKKDVRFDISQVRDVYMRMHMGEKPATLAKEYHVAFSTICKIRDKVTWKLVTDKLDEYFE